MTHKSWFHGQRPNRWKVATAPQPAGGKTLFCHSSISPARGGTDFFITDRVWISSVRTLDFPEISFGFVELNFWICRPACFERIQGRVGARPSMDSEEEEEAGADN